MDAQSIKRSLIFIVDDQQDSIQLLRDILENAGYSRFRWTNDPRVALSLFLECKPDLVILDLKMPHLDGFSVLRQLTARLSPSEYLPVIVLTADPSLESRQKALASGARDFLSKPFDPTEVVLRVRNLLETRWLYLQLEEKSHHFEQLVQERTKELEEAQEEILQRLAQVAEYRDDHVPPQLEMEEAFSR